MNKFFAIFIIVFWGCVNADQPQEVIANITAPEKEWYEAELDTILERNNPQALDLTRHQLFIDTTRSYSDNIDKEDSGKVIKPTFEHDFEVLNKISSSIKIDIGDFPPNFTTVQKWKDTFFLYDRCDGSDGAYEIRDSAIIFYMPLENYAETISHLIKKTDDQIKIQLNNFKGKYSYFEIEPTTYEGIFSLKYQSEGYTLKEYVIPSKDRSKFDIIVNHCPKMKRLEFSGFDQ